jgi:serine/threonine protein kinase
MLAEGLLLADRYRLEHPLAAGGMSDVWKATDEVLSRPVAVKVIRPGLLAQPGFAERFAAEARILAGLRHPGIVGVHDYGETAGPDRPSAYLVMEFIDGEPLSDRLHREHQLTAPVTMEIVAQAAEALTTAHRAGVVHRDIKPANLLVRPDGTVAVVDFGVAKAELSAGLTQTNTMLGTARYMAPEQVQGTTVSGATDVYALGAVAYECLTGTPAFDADSPIAIALKQVSEEAPELPPTVPAGARAVVNRALAKDPAQRFPDAAALAAAARAASQESLSDTATMPVVIPPPPRRSPFGLVGRSAAAGLAVLALIALGVILLALKAPIFDSPPAHTVPSIGSSSTAKPSRGATTGPSGVRPTAGPGASAVPGGSAPAQSPKPQQSASSAPEPSSSPEPEASSPAAGVDDSPSPPPAAGNESPAAGSIVVPSASP